MNFYFKIIFSNHLTVDLWLVTKPARLLSELSTSNQHLKYILFTSLPVHTSFTWTEFYFGVSLIRGKIHENVNYNFRGISMYSDNSCCIIMQPSMICDICWRLRSLLWISFCLFCFMLGNTALEYYVILYRQVKKPLVKNYE